ncbi:stressosome-associated protein Prli42 [Paenibacillus sp. GP183]|nr:stressosome-associated protein Prli42 [Paenibacillus sp. GP183]
MNPNKLWFKIVIYVMLISIVLSSLLFTFSLFM